MKSIDAAYLRWGKERFAPPTEARPIELEQQLGIRLPRTYREFVLKFNGGYFRCPEIVCEDEECQRQTLFIYFLAESIDQFFGLLRPTDFD